MTSGFLSSSRERAFRIQGENSLKSTLTFLGNRRLLDLFFFFSSQACLLTQWQFCISSEPKIFFHRSHNRGDNHVFVDVSSLTEDLIDLKIWLRLWGIPSVWSRSLCTLRHPEDGLENVIHTRPASDSEPINGGSCRIWIMTIILRFWVSQWSWLNWKKNVCSHLCAHHQRAIKLMWVENSTVAEIISLQPAFPSKLRTNQNVKKKNPNDHKPYKIFRPW